MSKRSNQKLENNSTKTLRFLREKTGLSMRKVASITGISSSAINHLENGRLDIKPRHLERLLPIYGINLEIFKLFESGKNALPQNVEADCIRILKSMNLEQLQASLSVLRSLSVNYRKET